MLPLRGSEANEGSEMNRRFWTLAGLTAASLAFGTIAAQAYTGEELAHRAKIGIAQARAIALKAHPEQSRTRSSNGREAAAAFVTRSTSSAAR